MNDFYNGKITDIAQLNPPESVSIGSLIKKIPMEFVQTFNRKITGFEISNYKSGPKFRNYDTLLAKITPCLENGKTAYVDILDKDEIAFGSSEFIVLRPKSLADKEFLYYFAISPIFRKRAILSMEGTSGRKRVNETTLKNHIFKIPSQLLRTDIGSVLASIDTKIELNQKLNIELEQTAKTIYEYWFVQYDFPNENGKPYKSSGGKMVWNEKLIGYVPEGWEIKPLEGMIDFDRGVSYTSEDIESADGIPMINLASIDVCRNYRPNELKFFSGKYNANKIVVHGDMLIACTDLTQNAHIIGSPIIVPKEYKKYLYSMDLAKVNILTDSLIDMYLYMTLRTDFYHNYIKHFASGTNVLHLNLDGILWYSATIPPIQLQSNFSDIIKSFTQKQTEIMNENNILLSLRDWLLPMFMNGQISVN